MRARKPDITLLHGKNRAEDQPVHLHSLIYSAPIRFTSKVCRGSVVRLKIEGTQVQDTPGDNMLCP